LELSITVLLVIWKNLAYFVEW